MTAAAARRRAPQERHGDPLEIDLRRLRTRRLLTLRYALTTIPLTRTWGCCFSANLETSLLRAEKIGRLFDRFRTAKNDTCKRLCALQCQSAREGWRCRSCGQAARLRRGTAASSVLVYAL